MRALVVVIMLAGTAQAQLPDSELPTVPQAVEHLRKGQAYFDRANYTAAIAEFHAGYAIEPKRAFLLALAQAERLGGDCKAAVPHYREFLATDPPDELKTFAERGLAGCPAIIEPTVEKPVEKPIVRPAWYRDRLTVGLAAGGVTMLVMSGLSAISARSAANEAERAPTLGRYEQLVDRADSRSALAVLTAITGGVLAGAAVTRYLLKRRQTVTVTTSGVAIGGRF